MQLHFILLFIFILVGYSIAAIVLFGHQVRGCCISTIRTVTRMVAGVICDGVVGVDGFSFDTTVLALLLEVSSANFNIMSHASFIK
jgi:hypothetical protein